MKKFLLLLPMLLIFFGCHHEEASIEDNIEEISFVQDPCSDEVSLFPGMFSAEMNIEDACITLAAMTNVWEVDREKVAENICALQSKSLYKEEWGIWEVQAELQDNQWVRITYTLCGKNYRLEEGACIQHFASEDDSKNLYLGSDYLGNYVWGGAMNLAWTELNENILHEKLQLNTNDATALDMVEKFNNPIFTKKDLDEKSYYIKSGYGQDTVDAINTESIKKFPSKSFEALSTNLSPEDIISYAYFLKEVEYDFAFEVTISEFGEGFVKGFYADTEKQKESIKIILYESDDKFIIKIQLKDNHDELILAKGFDMTNPQNIVDAINKNNNTSLPSLGESDLFEAPTLHLDHERNYDELTGEALANQDFRQYFIAQMFEKIKFDMDAKGARVENEAVIVTMIESMAFDQQYKKFFLDAPYWVVMKRKDSKNPYFTLGVNNTKMMTVVEE